MRPSAGQLPRALPNRAQSETLGLVLVFSIVIAGATIVVVFGAAAVGDSEQALSLERAEKSLTQLDSKAALVALENTDVQHVSFATRDGGRFTVQNGSGWMNVTIKNTTAGSTDHVVNQSLGRVVFDHSNDTLAYQGGGVWRASEGGSVMVSPPEFHFRNGTLTLPVINVTGDSSLDGGASLSHEETVKKFPDRSVNDRQNPLDQHRVFVEVQSEYYEAWGRYFEERTDGVVEYDHDANTAQLELVSPLGQQRITAATSSRAASGEFNISGSASVACGAVTVYTNSYNSSGTNDDYCTQAALANPGNEGDVIYGEDVDISTGSGSSNLRGNLKSGGNVTVTASGGAGQPDVHGNISYTDNCNPSISDCEDRIMTGSGGEVRQISGVSTMNHINRIVEDAVDDVEDDNDNASADISGGTLDFSANSPTDEVTLTSGKYYLEDVVLADDETLELDTSGGNITLAVRGGIELQGSGSGGGEINVSGDGHVKIYVQGIDSVHGRSNDVIMWRNGKFLTPNDNATRLRLYGRDNLTVNLDGSGSNLAKFVGVIYSPPGQAGTARVDIDGGEVYGGILTGTTTIDEGSIHYDEALKHTQIISRDEKVVKVTYLHVTVNRIHLESG